MVGNIDAAAECAFKCGRVTEALLLALSSNNDSLFDELQDQYFKNHQDPFVSTVLKRIVEEDRSKLTLDVGKSNWKEAVVYTLSYSEKNSKQLIEELGDELHKKKDINSAIICYLISEQIDKVAQLWKLRVEASIRKHPDCKEQVLNNFLQKVTYLRMATGSQAVVDDISDLVADFCEILAE